MTTAQLGGKPLLRRESYTALSYTWGLETETYPFACDGLELPVRGNLRDALCHLGEATVWIDAICINQADETEKFGQLKLMPQIYSNARQVVIWLGKDTDVTTRAITQIPEVIARMKAAKVYRDVIPDIADTDFVDGIHNVLTRPWWNRLWVLQEVALARSAVFLCGHQRVSW